MLWTEHMHSNNNGYFHLENVSKTYQEGAQERHVLKNVSASFKEGEFVAILGKSGSGKSTLLNLLSGIDLVDSGTICINGNDLTKMNEQQRTLFRRRNIGFIFQFFNLIPTLTVIENVILPAELNGINESQAKKFALNLLEQVGLQDREHTYPDRLSGGEQQRVAIARALINDPLLVLADEPTGNLDDITGKQVLTLLDNLTRQAGKNMIMVTHSMESSRFADRLLFLRNGQLQDQ